MILETRYFYVSTVFLFRIDYALIKRQLLQAVLMEHFLVVKDFHQEKPVSGGGFGSHGALFGFENGFYVVRLDFAGANCFQRAGQTANHFVKESVTDKGHADILAELLNVNAVDGSDGVIYLGTFDHK